MTKTLKYTQISLNLTAIAHTIKEEKDGEEIIRIISARQASPAEE